MTINSSLFHVGQSLPPLSGAKWMYPDISEFITTGPRNTLLDSQAILTADVTAHVSDPGRFTFTGIGGVAQTDAINGAIVGWRPRDDTGAIRPLDWAARSIGMEVIIHTGFPALSGGVIFGGFARNVDMIKNWSSGILFDQANPRCRVSYQGNVTGGVNNALCDGAIMNVLIRPGPNTVPTSKLDWATVYSSGMKSSVDNLRFNQVSRSINQQMTSSDDTIAWFGVMGTTGALAAFTVDATIRYWWATNPEQIL